VNRDDLRAGIPAGFLAATATAGALIAIGSRSSTAAKPFNVIASHLLGASRADVSGFVAGITIPGIALHIVLTTILGILVVVIVRRRLAPLWLTAISAALLCALVSAGIARRGGTSLAQILTLGDLLIFYLVLGASLALGIRFAFAPRKQDSERHSESM
jgi:hypothetical protein